MTRQSWTALSSAVVFVVLALLLGLLHVPFVAWAPGVTVNLLGTNRSGQPNVQVTGVKTYPYSGGLLMTTVSETRVDSSLSLPEALWAHVMPHHDVLPREVIYPPSMNSQQVNQQQVEMMDTSQQSALVAALRAAGQPVQAMPVVSAVNVNGPADGRLHAGDLIEKVDGTAVQKTDDVHTLIQKHKVGQTVQFTVLRQNRQMQVGVVARASTDGKNAPRVGITVDVGYKTTASASYGIDPGIVGPSAGLMFSLAIYDQLMSTDLTNGRTIAGTGEIDASGSVSPIGGIQEKIAAASAAHASVFLVPAGNCVDLAGVHTHMTLVKVTKLGDAIASIAALHSPDTAKEIPHC